MKTKILLTVFLVLLNCSEGITSQSGWPSEWVNGGKKYQKVQLVQPRHNGNEVRRFRKKPVDGGKGEDRHMEWFEDLLEDSQTAGTTEKGFIEEFFTEEEEASLKADDDLRRHKKKYVKVNQYFLPLLMAYKLKFFTMVPLLIGALVLLTTTTGLAGFFFALFAAATGLHNKGTHGRTL